VPQHDAFHQFEHDGWQRVPGAYDDGFGRLTAGAADALLDAAGVGRGTHVIDLASGPGYVAATAAKRGAHAIGVDFSEAMVEFARSQNRGVDYVEGNAEDLDFDEGTFDAAVMNFGLLHLGRPELALAEAHRVLRPGGRLAFTVWCTPDQAVGFGIVLRAVDTFGVTDAAVPAGPPFFRFSDPAESRRALAGTGFTDVRTATLPLVWLLPAPDALFDRMYAATVRTGGLLRAQSRSALQRIRTAMAAEAADWEHDGVIALPMPALLASGARIEG
jgi:SAM-dependent methyltransferase